MGEIRREPKREQSNRWVERQKDSLYLERNMEQMQSSLLTHLVLERGLCLMSVAAEAVGFLQSTAGGF